MNAAPSSKLLQYHIATGHCRATCDLLVRPTTHIIQKQPAPAGIGQATAGNVTVVLYTRIKQHAIAQQGQPPCFHAPVSTMHAQLTLPASPITSQTGTKLQLSHPPLLTIHSCACCGCCTAASSTVLQCCADRLTHKHACAAANRWQQLNTNNHTTVQRVTLGGRSEALLLC